MKTNVTRLTTACLISLAFLAVALIPSLVVRPAITYAQSSFAYCNVFGAVGCFNCVTNPSPGGAGCSPIPTGWFFGSCSWSSNPLSSCLSGTFNCGANLDCLTKVQVGNCQPAAPVCT